MFNFIKRLPSIAPADVQAKLSDKSIGFIDVRTETEFVSGHAEGATNIPLDMLPDRISELKDFKTVYVICRSGGRSVEAVGLLRAKGIDAVNVIGGTIHWKSSGLPMV